MKVVVFMFNSLFFVTDEIEKERATLATTSDLYPSTNCSTGTRTVSDDVVKY